MRKYRFPDRATAEKAFEKTEGEKTRAHQFAGALVTGSVVWTRRKKGYRVGWWPMRWGPMFAIEWHPKGQGPSFQLFEETELRDYRARVWSGSYHPEVRDEENALISAIDTTLKLAKRAESCT